MARRDIERVDVPEGNVMLMENVSMRVEEITEVKNLVPQRNEPRVTRSSSRLNTTSDTML